MLLPVNEIFVFGDRRPLLGVTFADAGVEEHQLAVGGLCSRPRKCMLLAAALCGPERDRLVFPIDEVLAAKVAPMHVSPTVAVRVVLVEDVIVAVVVDEAVGVVHPIRRR